MSVRGHAPEAAARLRAAAARGGDAQPFSADQGKVLFVLDGTKGGRARAVPIDTPEKRDLIERAKVMASGNARRLLSANHRTLDRARHAAMKDLLAQLEGDPELLAVVAASGIASWWVIGAAAAGEPVGQTLTLAYQSQRSEGQTQLEADLAAMPQALKVAAAAGTALRACGCAVPQANLAGQEVERLEIVGWFRLVTQQAGGQETANPGGSAAKH